MILISYIRIFWLRKISVLTTLFHSDADDAAAADVFGGEEIFIFDEDCAGGRQIAELFKEPAAYCIHLF